MSERDDDILDFDFFDEPPTVEQQRSQRPRMAMPRRRREGRPPRPPVRPPQGFAPLLRLTGLVAFAILIVVLLVFWVQSCESSSKRNAYKSYMTDVGTIGRSSAAVGNDLANALTTPGQKQAALEKAVNGLAQREQQDVAKAEQLDPPGPLRPEHQALVQALQFRVSGLEGLATTLHAAQPAKATAAASAALAASAQRFVASDVMWQDLFAAPAAAELQKQGIGGVQVPSSTFLTNPELATPRAWSQGILPRLAGASTGGTVKGGLHGSALQYVEALPSKSPLSQTAENTVTATTDLGFDVGVKDSGNSQEVGIDVTLTIEKPSGSIVRTQRIQVIDPGQVVDVVFKNLGQVPFAQKTTLKVDIAPVPGEANVKNNSGVYPVIFSLG